MGCIGGEEMLIIAKTLYMSLPLAKMVHLKLPQI